jgi:hypothetical protein
MPINIPAPFFDIGAANSVFQGNAKNIIVAK